MGANFDMANSHFDWNNPPLPKTAMRVQYEQEIVYEAFVDQALVTRTWANVTVRLDAHGPTMTLAAACTSRSCPSLGGRRARTGGYARRVDARARPLLPRRQPADPLGRFAAERGGSDGDRDQRRDAPVPGGFAYFTPVRASGVSPCAGPVHGHTRLSVSGSLLAPAPQLELPRWAGRRHARRRRPHHLLHPERDFDDQRRRAPRRRPRRRLRPRPAPEASTPLRLSLDGQTFTPAADVRFRLYPQPNVSRLLPWTGPAAGGTVVASASSGCGDGGEPVGVDYRCRFGNGAKVVATVAGSYGLYRDRLIYVAPNVGRPQATPLELTLNGQQYTESGVVFAHRAPLVVTAVEPPRGRPRPHHRPRAVRRSRSSRAAAAKVSTTATARRRLGTSAAALASPNRRGRCSTRTAGRSACRRRRTRRAPPPLRTVEFGSDAAAVQRRAVAVHVGVRRRRLDGRRRRDQGRRVRRRADRRRGVTADRLPGRPNVHSVRRRRQPLYAGRRPRFRDLHVATAVQPTPLV